MAELVDISGVVVEVIVSVGVVCGRKLVTVGLTIVVVVSAPCVEP